MRRPFTVFTVFMAMTASGVVQAGDFDGKTPLICALTDLQSCAPDHGCRRASASDVNMPTFLHIDIAAKAINGQRPDGEKVTTAIETVQQNSQGLVLQGIDGGRSWNAVIDADGQLSVAAIGIDAGFLVFGECTVR